MEGAGAGSSQGGVVGGAGSFRGEGGDRDAVYKGELSDGMGEEEGKEGEERGLEMGVAGLEGSKMCLWGRGEEMQLLHEFSERGEEDEDEDRPVQEIWTRPGCFVLFI